MHTQFELQAPLFHNFVDLHARWYPHKVAVLDDEQALNWQQLAERANQVANGLVKEGIKPGDSVAILMRNCVEYVEVLYGAFKAGAVVVPLNTAVNNAGVEGMLVDSAAKILFCCAAQAARWQPDNRPDSWDARIVELNSDSNNPNYASWRNANSTLFSDIEIDDSAPCNIIYSSGTTGLPKGIKHTHRRRVQAMYELALAHRYHFGAISICPIGLYSNIAWASLFCSLIVGGTCVIRASFTPENWINDVEKYEVTHTMMAPIMFQRILAAPNFSAAKVTSLQAVISGGSPLFEQLKKTVIEQFRCAVIELYGLTEGFMTTLQPEEAEGKLTSVGKPVRGNNYILVDNDDQIQPLGGTGEICTRSVHWMIEYHNRPDATEEIVLRDKNGLLWMRTGDIGRTDKDGFLYIVDRKKDMILSGGQNIYPADIEAVMVNHADVSEVAVIGVSDETWGETPVAVIVPNRPMTDADIDSLLTWTNERVGKRQRIRSVYLNTDMPRNPNGKILKRELRAKFESTPS